MIKSKSKTDIIFYLLLFTSGFTATSIYNLNNIDFSLPFVIGVFFIIFELKNIILKIHNINLKKVNLFLIFFIIISFFSILFSKFITPNFKITFQSGIYDYYLHDTRTMVKHYIYLLYCFCIYLMTLVYFYNIEQKKTKYESIIRNLKYSSRVLFLIGIYQIIAYRFNLKFDEIFRMNPSSNTQPYGTFIRVSGPNIEPSMFSIYLVLVVSILLFDDIKKNYKDIILLIITGILTTSSTFFIGLLLIFLNYIVFSKNRTKIIKIGILMIGIYMILIVIYPQILSLTTGIVDKILGKGVSGSERSFNMINHIEVGLIYPLSGIGYGMARSKDLLSSWIANIGFLGVGLFILGIMASIKKTNVKTRGFYIGLVVIFLLEFISVPEPYFIYIWLIWGVIDSGFLKKI